MPRPSLTRLFALHRLDQATADVDDARAKLANAESAFQAAHLGPIREELAIADDKVQQAAAAASGIAANYEYQRRKTALLRCSSPSPAKAVIPGQPVMTLEAAGRRWASFNLREDQLDGLRIGSPVELLPVAGSERSEAAISEIIPRGEFATWRAARVVGDYDLNTFLVRADPVTPAAALQPGMTVWLEPTSRTVR